jgi:hypothetical protein
MKTMDRHQNHEFFEEQHKIREELASNAPPINTPPINTIETLKLLRDNVKALREMTSQGHHEDRIFFSGYNDGLARVVELIDEMIGEDEK